ncbi:MAG: twin-arginine translocase TatA/TatE family subunit [Acidimicrobiales bacterium]|nr:twin-arginine translocase TatA/TatE family subunit [Acidimicrobiales bacterium]
MINMPGGPEIAVILLVALIVLGPQQLPKAMRTLGNAMAEIRKISSGFQAEMRNAMNSIETQAEEVVQPASPAAPDATEIVAKNPAEQPPTSASQSSADSAQPPAANPPTAIDPADRAAG